MRVIALLSLFLGFMGMMLLDGQTFTHAVMGIIFGIAAIWGGLASARKDHAIAERRRLGRIMAALGLVLALFCAIQLPSGYRFQERFNARSREFHGRNHVNPSADFHALGLEDVDEAKKLFDIYKQVYIAQIFEDYWEDEGLHKSSLHCFKASVTTIYKGGLNTGEKVSFYYCADAPALTVSNAFVGSNMLLLANGHAANDIPFGVGDFFLVDTNVQQVLQCVFPERRQ
ncbi:MAG TPA: hypothetical protein VK815_03710 [Candidatus Acidoferrales bacterium]|jgi:hypothetical protein|nr:hypothetical protein [Candidatus Acidoferrales bacterium]